MFYREHESRHVTKDWLAPLEILFNAKPYFKPDDKIGGMLLPNDKTEILKL